MSEPLPGEALGVDSQAGNDGQLALQPLELRLGLEVLEKRRNLR